jgi:hypothetical protein
MENRLFIYELMLQVIIRNLATPKNEKIILRFLTKLEYGVSIFCYKLAVKARTQNKECLANCLMEHGNDELKHGKMLGCVSDGKNFIKKNTDWGRWIPDLSKHENFDGISRRYLSARLFFMNKKAIYYDWVDRLAFMYVLEKLTNSFYITLSATEISEPLKAIAAQIAEDEQSHSDYLLEELKKITDKPQHYVKKWERRANFAIIGVVIDAIFIFVLKK